MPLLSLPTIVFEPLVRAALLEDLGRACDLTSDAIVPADLVMTESLTTRQPGAVAGLDLAALAFGLIDDNVEFDRRRQDGEKVAPGDVVAVVRGSARDPDRRTNGVELPLPAQRYRLGNCVDCRGRRREKGPHRLHAQDDGLRAIEKYAVRAGGGVNYRFGLDDAVLIKDNHMAIAGSVAAAVERARSGIGHLVKIEVEVDTLPQLEQALAVGVDAVLLDNMSVEQLRRAVEIVAGRAVTEASGRVTSETAAAIAATGVDLISIEWLTHGAPALDIGLDVQTRDR